MFAHLIVRTIDSVKLTHDNDIVDDARFSFLLDMTLGLSHLKSDHHFIVIQDS